MTKDLFYEIGTEEIPARFIDCAINDIKTIADKYLSELKIKFEKVEVFSTPRRFAIVIRNLAEKQEDIEDFIKGPSKKAGYDENNNPTKALLGFVNSKGGKLEDVEIVKNGNDEYLYLKLFQEGKETETFIKNILDKIIRNINFAKPMKWGNKNIKFIRPIRWLVCLYGNKLVEFDIEGIYTSNITKGHRFLGASEIEVNSFEDYKQKLKDNFVILDHIERKELIRKQANDVAKSINGNVIIEEEILDEVNFIVEYPTAFYGNFDKSYLELPKEVVITPMQNHQRYFPVVESNGNLMNYFITVRNGDDYMIENVRKGNNRVLDARLKDAQFFYIEDTKKKLETYVENLKTIVFHQKLGSMFDKVERLKVLANDIAKFLNFDTKNIDRAAMLCKADLTTQMVFEFGELQGIMGRYYANSSGENTDVANAIFEHYLPRNADDIIAESDTGISLAIADKMDTITGFFSIGIQPTGSQDPYALRRQAIGVLSTSIQRKLDISILDLVDLSAKAYSNPISDEAKQNIVEFLVLRLNNIMLDMGIRQDVVKSMAIHKNIPIHKIILIANNVMQWLEQDKLEQFTTFIRANNLIKNENDNVINADLFVDNAEKELHENSTTINKAASDYILKNDYKSALLEIEKVVPYINALFDSVMIMDKDEKVKNNRLVLLNNSLEVLNGILNIEEINYK